MLKITTPVAPTDPKPRGALTINDVARIAGVSKKTVSRVINRSAGLHPETRGSVERVIAELGYTPNPQARALARGRNFLIGLVHGNPNAQTVLNVQRGMLEALGGTDFEMLVRPVDRGSPTLVEDLRDFIDRNRLHGLLLMPPLSENEAVAQMCRDAGCRYVRMGSTVLDEADRSVASNDRAVVREATGHLIAQGHRRIGLVAGPDGFRSAIERRAGFEDALRAAGLPLFLDLVERGDYLFGSGETAGERLLGRPDRPTAIFASNDEMAVGVIHAAYRMGLHVPDDLSVIGFDGTAVAAQVWPPLTTVMWPVAAMARAATFKLIGPALSSDHAAEAALLCLPASVIHRGSVAPPAAGQMESSS